MPPPGGQSKPVFATAPYAADEHGVLRGVLSPRCVFALASETCALFVAHYRPRLTGPGFPVAVWGARFIPFSATPRIRPWQDPLPGGAGPKGVA